MDREGKAHMAGHSLIPRMRMVRTQSENENGESHQYMPRDTRSEPHWLADDITWQAIIMTHHEWYS